MPSGNETDQLALLEFKAKVTDDPLGVMNSWNVSIHFCQWYGVTCGHRHQRVTVLDLSSLKLAGTISPHIGNLSFLRILNLPNNSLTQEIPSEIGYLHRLKALRLQNNSFSGKIPSNTSGCYDLRFLNVGRNKLVGEIPTELGTLSKIMFVLLHHNNLTGRIPSSLGNLSSLEALWLFENNLDGGIPSVLGKLTNLTDFRVGGNKFSGLIPPSLFNLSLIETFDLSDNKIQGSLPSNIGISLPNIQRLSLSSNQFIGPIPVSISNASTLVELQLPDNNFTGEVPSLENLPRLDVLSISFNYLGNDLSFLCSLTNTTNLRVLALNLNNFGGAIPECISNLSTALSILWLDNNMISGSMPGGIGKLVNLEDLKLWNNHLSGNLHPSIGKLQKLVLLNLAINEFSGKIPYSLGNLTLVTEMYMDRNNFQGTIPLSLGNCQNLLALGLSSNSLTGPIPPQVFSLASLSIYLDLSENNFIGALPSEVGNLKNLGQLFVHDNMLSGKIPAGLGSCVSLEKLDLHGNHFQGSIPPSLTSLRGLQEIDFSHNNLSGKIPEFFASFILLLKLNLSFNDFEGIMPTKGLFKNATITSVMGNRKLCGGIPEFKLPRCNFKKNVRLTVKLKAILATVAAVLGMALVLSVVFLSRQRKKHQELPPSSSDVSLLRLSYQNLHDATKGFSSNDLIGVGSFGSVYRGILEEGGAVIAVKVLNLQNHRAIRSFVAECQALRNIRHRNLVKVITACSSIDRQGNEFKALVYEYMANGNLDEWLHPPAASDGNQAAPKNLNLLQRLNIAIDVASALEYLHYNCGTPIVHCDLKPSNILLDNELTGHISDFGLAKFRLPRILEDSTDQSSSVGLRGTVGYTPPEYGLGSEVSTYGDLYSYGILLLEMFTGKRPTHDTFKEGMNIHRFAELALPDRVAEIADPILLQERNKAKRNGDIIIMECLISIIGIGVACSVELPTERMSISDVAMKLCSIRDKFLRTV
ncbi:hypothetical protein JCGZ_01444 [Jatropha curcas]|uniref:non-specific serine/threonine protein kinase n=2 Tax=Jatropha curcas TaxID=180498 RepID=A0A067LKS3_JATCU|nr:hypothetical protein JCGZ_01444 [Jatropha curcas]